MFTTKVLLSTYLYVTYLFLEMVVYISTIFMLTTFYNRILNDVANHSFVFIWKSIAISSFGLFLLLPSLMWNNNAFWDFHVIFVYLYTTLSHLLAYTCKSLKERKLQNINLICLL